jgi:phosphomannomutase
LKVEEQTEEKNLGQGSLVLEKKSSITARFYSYREIIKVENIDIYDLIEKIKIALIEEGDNVIQSNIHLQIGERNNWFVLIHPSNTESAIRVISEAKSNVLSRIYCEATAELVKLVIQYYHEE